MFLWEVDSDPDAEAASMNLERLDPDVIYEDGEEPLDGKLSWDFE